MSPLLVTVSNELATAGRFPLTIQGTGTHRTCHFIHPVVTGFNLERVPCRFSNRYGRELFQPLLRVPEALSAWVQPNRRTSYSHNGHSQLCFSLTSVPRDGCLRLFLDDSNEHCSQCVRLYSVLVPGRYPPY